MSTEASSLITPPADDRAAAARPATVRDATFDMLRSLGMTTVYSNPGSTEIAFLTGFPDDLDFVLGLHEGAVVSMASGYALGSGRPAFVLLHTTAGLGNAVSALATARASRAPLVVAVGQQDRRHLALEPFLAGRLEGLAGDYPVSVETPLLAQDIPGALRRAHASATVARGPALVVVPQGDWLEAAPEPNEISGPERVVVARGADDASADELAALLDGAATPVIVAGAGSCSDEGWAALVELAERLRAPVWQECFGPRAGFPQTHPLFAGHLPADRARVRDVLAGHDVVLAVGAPVFRQYPFVEGPFAADGTRFALVSDDLAEVRRSPVEIAVLGDPAAVCRAVAARIDQRDGDLPAPAADFAGPPPPAPGRGLVAAHVLAALAERLPENAVVVEESPSSRHQLTRILPARTPLGYVSAAMGGLGFAVPGAAGLRHALPDRPVVAIVGDGAAMFGIHGLWGAARYKAGVLYVVLSNGGYKVMDKLADMAGAPGPWPEFGEIDIAAIATAQGCEAIVIDDHATLLATLDEVVGGLATRTSPLLLDVRIDIDDDFNP